MRQQGRLGISGLRIHRGGLSELPPLLLFFHGEGRLLLQV
jgi:hypothetical protein